ncbi:hypothetical protein J3L16_15565 [Alteromonas sp. 5E99-2]|uniref:hypothetical protein n=1 Tax=Alteromonas sp. 5E99-2 TaxID=2817683 RepID=UPI001A9A21B8|nr:hypothetical protein [Alteromonas sp. 5E99-2]MBO1257102.1 hypothetical protein [Alteromonas sp. 5E99-2]
MYGSSPYISELSYDIDNRILTVTCVDNPDDFNPATSIVFSGVKSYSEESLGDSNADDIMDSIIGMNWHQENIFCLHTQKKEIMIELENEPVSSNLA